MSHDIQEILCHAVRESLLLGVAVGIVYAQSNSRLTGTVTDPSDRAIPSAEIRVRNLATLVERTATTNGEGIYEIAALPLGTYRMQVRAPGFRLYTVEALTTDVARTTRPRRSPRGRRHFEEITVRSQAALIDGATTSVGHVIDGRTVQEIPLNGRYFLDLALLVPGRLRRRRVDSRLHPAVVWGLWRLIPPATARRL